MKNEAQILIVGYGNVGKHIYKELYGAGEIDIYDKHIEGHNVLTNKLYDFAFVCVPTEMKEDGSADTSIVEEVVNEINAKIIVIKSAIPVCCCKKLMDIATFNNRSNVNKNIIVSPEYYGTTIYSPDSPNFLVLGGYKNVAKKVAELYYKVKPNSFRVYYTDEKTAALAKYMENCFLALKATFCNEFAMIAKSFGIDYPELREIFVLDERMGDSHTFVFPEQPYYDSHCLNKDVPALIKQAKDVDPYFDKSLMERVLEINQRMKEKYKND